MDTTCTAVVFGYGYESALWYGGMYRISDQTAVSQSLLICESAVNNPYLPFNRHSPSNMRDKSTEPAYNKVLRCRLLGFSAHLSLSPRKQTKQQF